MGTGLGLVGNLLLTLGTLNQHGRLLGCQSLPKPPPPFASDCPPEARERSQLKVQAAQGAGTSALYAGLRASVNVV